MTGVRTRRGKCGHRQREGSHMKMEAEVGVMLPQAGKHMGLPEPERGKERPPPQATQCVVLRDCSPSQRIQLALTFSLAYLPPASISNDPRTIKGAEVTEESQRASLTYKSMNSMRGENIMSTFLRPNLAETRPMCLSGKIPQWLKPHPCRSHWLHNQNQGLHEANLSFCPPQALTKPAQHFKGGLDPVGLSSPAVHLRPRARGEREPGQKLGSRAPVFSHVAHRATVV